MHDLAEQFVQLGHQALVVAPAPDLESAWSIEHLNGFCVLRVKTPNFHTSSHFRRTLNECRLPLLLMRGMRKAALLTEPWDMVVWYSPTIFFGPLVWYIKMNKRCRAYLILRDIFPEWAADLGIMRKSVAYAFFKIIAWLQYSVADVIGVQTESNLAYIKNWENSKSRKLEVLRNWQMPRPNTGCSLQLTATPLAGRKIFVYIGNMGIAQGMDILIELAACLRARRDVGFLFVGRGSEVSRLIQKAKCLHADNTLFHDELPASEMPGLLAQCFVGLITLDPRHNTHNIPGKFLTYLLSSLPILARVNGGTDLLELINKEHVGYACDTTSPEILQQFAEGLVESPAEREAMSSRCLPLARSMFSPSSAVHQIVHAMFDQHPPVT